VDSLSRVCSGRGGALQVMSYASLKAASVGPLYRTPLDLPMCRALNSLPRRVGEGFDGRVNTAPFRQTYALVGLRR
jgi:hypothetical protein